MNNNNDDNAALPLENNDKINYRLLYADRIAELEAALAAAQTKHCKDCCCAKAWEALGVTEYTGKDIPQHIAELRQQLASAQERNTALQSEHLDHVNALNEQLTAAQEREAAYRNALMDAAKDFDRADMGNCCQHVMDELNRIINAAEADHAEHK